MHPLLRLFQWPFGDCFARIEGKVDTLIQEIAYMTPQLQKLHDSVEKNTNANASIVALVQGLSQQIRDAKEDPEELGRLADQLDASTSALAAATLAGTSSGGGTASPPQTDPTKSSATIPSVSSITPNTPKPEHPSPDPSANPSTSSADIPSPTGNDGTSGPDAAANKAASDASSNR